MTEPPVWLAVSVPALLIAASLAVTALPAVVLSTIPPFVPVAVRLAPASTLSSEVITVASLAPIKATELPLIDGDAPPLSSTSISAPPTADPAVIVTLSGLPIPAVKLASVAATSAALPVAVALPLTVIFGAASNKVPTRPDVAVVLNVPPIVIEPLPPVSENGLVGVTEARN